MHESVLVGEVLAHIKSQARVIDATTGNGGHTKEMLDKGAYVLGIERDPEMLTIASERLKAYPTSKLVLGNFTDIDKIAIENNFVNVDVILMDLGVTNLHLTADNRGFSFANLSDPLDMRLDSNIQGVKASDLLNVLRPDQLEEMFGTTMDYSSSRWLSKQVAGARSSKPFEIVADLIDITENLRTQKTKINKSTLPFLALRIAVNRELDNLEETLPKAYKLLVKGGKLLVITFHSGEEKIVNEFNGNALTIFPTGEEVSKNPRSRSAKLKVIYKK